MAVEESVKVELLNLIQERLLSWSSDPIPNDWLIAYRLEDALFACGREFACGEGGMPDGFDQRIGDGQICSWLDLRGGAFNREIAYRVEDYGEDTWRRLKDEYKGAQRIVEDAAEEKAEQLLGVDVADEVCSDFETIFNLLHHTQCKEPLPWLLKRAYERGLWPCGWLGEYRDGQLIVYWRYDEPPTRCEPLSEEQLVKR